MCQILFTSFTKEKYLDKYLKKYFAKLCQPDYWCSICLAPPPSLCVGILTWHCRYQQFIFVHHWTVHKYQYLRELSIKEHELTTLVCSAAAEEAPAPKKQLRAPQSSAVASVRAVPGTAAWCGACAAVGTPWEQSPSGARPGNLSPHLHNILCTCEGSCPLRPGPQQPDDNKNGRPDRAARDQVRAEPRWFPQQCRVQQPSTTTAATTAGHSQQLSTMGELNKSHFLSTKFLHFLRPIVSGCMAVSGGEWRCRLSQYLYGDTGRSQSRGINSSLSLLLPSSAPHFGQ